MNSMLKSKHRRNKFLSVFVPIITAWELQPQLVSYSHPAVHNADMTSAFSPPPTQLCWCPPLTGTDAWQHRNRDELSHQCQQPPSYLNSQSRDKLQKLKRKLPNSARNVAVWPSMLFTQATEIIILLLFSSPWDVVLLQYIHTLSLARARSLSLSLTRAHPHIHFVEAAQVSAAVLT